MLDRMAQYFLNPVRELLPRETAKQYQELRIKWPKLYKLLKDANLNRNKLAHYTADFDLINMRTIESDIVFDVKPPTLRPSQLNFVSRLLGRTKDKKEHNLGVLELKQYVVEFKQAQQATAAFLLELGKLPEGHTPIGGPKEKSPEESPHTPETPRPTDEPPSDQ